MTNMGYMLKNKYMTRYKMKYYIISEEELMKVKDKLNVNILEADMKNYDPNKVNISKNFYAETENDVAQYINDQINEYCEYNGDVEDKCKLKNKMEEIENFYWSNLHNANDSDILYEFFNELL